MTRHPHEQARLPGDVSCETRRGHGSNRHHQEAAWETPTTCRTARHTPMVAVTPADSERRKVMSNTAGQPAPAIERPEDAIREPSHGSRLDPWTQSYAQRTAGMTTSEIRALFAVASRPEVVSLAGGMPYLSALPMDTVAATVAQMLATQGLTALQYGSG